MIHTGYGYDGPVVPTITPHMFRRWALERFIEATGDLHAAAELAGHADVNQTRRYAGRAKIARTRVGVAALDRATRVVAPHDTPRTSGGVQNDASEPWSGRTWDRTRAVTTVRADAGSDASEPEEA